MGSVRVRIKDFEAIKKADFTVEGLTGLVGETNAGKSSTVRAIQFALLNRAGKDYIRHGCSKAMVGMSFTGFAEHLDFKFTWMKGASSTYKLPNDVVLEKTGRILPQEVLEGTGIWPLDLDNENLLINVLAQLEPPLLRDLSEARMYSLIVRSLDGDRLGDAVTQAKEDTNAYSVSISETTIEVSLLKKRLLQLREKSAILKSLEPLKKGYQRYLLEQKTFTAGQEKALSLAQVSDRISECESKRRVIASALAGSHHVAALRAIVEETKVAKTLRKELQQHSRAMTVLQVQFDSIRTALRDTDTVSDHLRTSKRLRQLKSRRTELKNCQHEITNSTTKITKISEALVGHDNLAKYSRACSRIARAQRLSDNYCNAREQLSNHQDAYNEVVNTIKRVEGMIENGVCPVCETTVGKGCDMDLTQVQRNIEELKQKQASMEGRLETLNDQQERIKKEIEALGMDPNNMDSEIETLSKKLEQFEKKLAPIVENINQALVDLEAPGGSTDVGLDDDDSFDLD